MDKIINQVEAALKKEKILFASYAVTNKNNTCLLYTSDAADD